MKGRNKIHKARETVYCRHTARRQLLWYLNNLKGQSEFRLLKEKLPYTKDTPIRLYIWIVFYRSVLRGWWGCMGCVRKLAGQIISKLCCLSSETEFTSLILASNQNFVKIHTPLVQFIKFSTPFSSLRTGLVLTRTKWVHVHILPRPDRNSSI